MEDNKEDIEVLLSTDVQEEKKPKKKKIKKKKKMKPVYIVIITVVSFILLLFILFLLFGSIFLKLKVENSDEVIEIAYGTEEFEYPDATCTFFGQNLSNRIKRDTDLDLEKVGEQKIEYSCKKFIFNKSKVVTFNVVDKEPPVMELNGADTIDVFIGDEYEELGCKAIDNVDGDISEKVTIEGTVDTSAENTFTITYSIKDSSGNLSQLARTVNVVQKNISIVQDLSCGEPGTIYLTFDDGPDNNYTPIILDVLQKHGVKATFFVTGKGSDDLILREFNEGHAIGVHTLTHEYSIVYKSDEAFWNDMNQVQDRIERLTGKSTKLFRFPGGASNTVSRKYSSGIMSRLAYDIQDRGYQYFDWNISSGDAGGTTDPYVEYQNVVTNLSRNRGNVILMHDIKKHTANAIDDIVQYGQDNGYKFDVLTPNVICHQRIAN